MPTTSLPWYRQDFQCCSCGEIHARHLCCQATRRNEFHEGELELITWRMCSGVDSDGDECEALGWGGVLLEEEGGYTNHRGDAVPGLKERLENEMGGDLCKFRTLISNKQQCMCVQLLTAASAPQ